MNKQKIFVISALCFIFAFATTSVSAVLTLSATTITSDGSLILTPAVSGKVGIGLTNPAFKLDVEGGIASRNSSPTQFGELHAKNDTGLGIDIYALGSTFGNTFFGGVTGNNQAVIEAATGVSSLYIGANATVPIIFAPGRIERMRVDGGGNGFVGIGTTNPGEKLQIAGAVKVTGPIATHLASAGSMDFFGGHTRFFSHGADSSTLGGFEFSIDTSTGTNVVPLIINNTGNIGIGGVMVANSNTLIGSAMTLLSNGRVGIGTTTPGTTLDVQGGVNLETGTGTVASNAVTISKTSGVITDPTDIGVDTTRAAIVLTNTRILATSIVVASICSALDTNAALQVWTVPASGSASVLVRNSGTGAQTSDYKICFIVTN